MWTQRKLREFLERVPKMEPPLQTFAGA